MGDAKLSPEVYILFYFVLLCCVVWFSVVVVVVVLVVAVAVAVFFYFDLLWCVCVMCGVLLWLWLCCVALSCGSVLLCSVVYSCLVLSFRC